MEINIPKLKCERCEYKWFPRTNKVIVCPKCKSPYWDRPIKIRRKQ